MMHLLVPPDTTLEAARVQWAVFDRMAPAQRLALALGMGDSLRQLVVAGVRSRRPELTDDQVRLEAIRLSLGDELFNAAFPGEAKPP